MKEFFVQTRAVTARAYKVRAESKSEACDRLETYLGGGGGEENIWFGYVTEDEEEVLR